MPYHHKDPKGTITLTTTHMGKMEKKMETTIMDVSRVSGSGLYGDNGKENRNCYIIIGYMLRLYRDNGKANGNYYLLFDFGKGGMMLRFSHQPLW